MKVKAVLLVILFFLSAFVSYAEMPATDDPYPDYQEDVFMDMELMENLLTPKVPKEAHKAIVSYINKVAKGLKHRYTIDLQRNDEVFVVVIPTDDLFLPNDTLFSDEAYKIINPLLDLADDPYMYKIVVAVHTDDTGSEAYRQNLSYSRINSVYDWLMEAIDNQKLSEDQVIIPYALGSDFPLVSNDTRRHRKENRRLEFYFIPGPRMIEKAVNHKLK